MVEAEQDCKQIFGLETVETIGLKMLEDGICCNVIARCIGLPKEEIKKLNNHECDH